MTRALTCFLLSALLSASAQDPKPPANAPAIAGTVVNEPGSHPLKKVTVEVIAEDPKQGEDYSAITDADGHFRIENVQPGRYRVFFEKTGFIEVNSRGQRAGIDMVTVPSGQSVEDLMFHMLSTAVITGRITDEDGDPMSQVRVVALRKVPGKTKWESVGTVGTDDQGEYRLASLFPGQYWIAAMPPPVFRDYERPHEKSSSADSQPETRYLTTYYPGTYDGTQASPIALKAGDELPVNLTLVPARTYRVRGIVTVLTPGQRPAVDLISKTGDSIQASDVGPDGAFEIHGAAPGSYVLRAYSTGELSVLTARQEVTVVAADVDGVKLVPLPSFTLAGLLHIEGQSASDVTQYSVNLRQADLSDDPGIFMSEDTFGENAQVDRLGNFAWKNVNPGNYILRVYGGDGKENFFLKSARIGDRNIDAGFTVSGPAGLNVVISTNAGTVEGSVTDKDQHGNDAPVSNVQVVAVPEEKYRKIPERFGVGATDQFGRFTIRGVAPGSYTIYAWQDVEEGLYRDPDFLKSQQANGTSVKVEEGSRQKVELMLSAVGEDWR